MGISATGSIIETAILTEMLELSGGNFNHTVHKVYTKKDLAELVGKYGFNWENSFWFGLDQLSDPEIRDQNGGAGLVKLEGETEAYVWVTSQKDGRRIIHTNNIGVYRINSFRRGADPWDPMEKPDFSKGWGALYINAIRIWEAANGSNYKEYEEKVLIEAEAYREVWTRSVEGQRYSRHQDDDDEIPF